MQPASPLSDPLNSPQTVASPQSTPLSVPAPSFPQCFCLAEICPSTVLVWLENEEDCAKLHG